MTRSRYLLRAAGPADDAPIRALLRETPMEGRFRVCFEREPSFYAGAAVGAELLRVGVAVDERSDGRIAGFGTYALGRNFVAGEDTLTAYLGNLRVGAAYRGTRLVARGFRLLEEWQREWPAQAAYTVIFEDNGRAREVLVGGRAGLPQYLDRGRLHCPGVNLTRRRPELDHPGVAFRRAGAADWPRLVRFLNGCGRRREFAPVHSAEDFAAGRRWPGLRAEHFWLAERDGDVVATCAAWDQSAYKQARLAGYGGSFRWISRLSNALQPILGTPRFPRAGEVLPFFIQSFAHAAPGEQAAFAALFRHFYNAHLGGGHLYFIACFHERDPLRSVLADYRLTPFASRLYEVVAAGARAKATPTRIPSIEAACL